MAKLDQSVYDSLDYMPFGKQFNPRDVATDVKFSGDHQDREAVLRSMQRVSGN